MSRGRIEIERTLLIVEEHWDKIDFSSPYLDYEGTDFETDQID